MAIEYARGPLGAQARRDPATVVLDPSVPWRIEARGALREVTADLGPGILAGFEAQGGVTGLAPLAASALGPGAASVLPRRQ